MRQKADRKTGRHRKRIPIVISIVFLLVAAGLMLYFFKQNKPETNMDWQQQQDSFTMENMQGDVVSAYGVTSIGTTEGIFPITSLEKGLEIEEVYIAAGEAITEENPLFKVTEQSLEEVRTELEKELREADLAYRAGAIEYEQSKITAYYEKENTLLTGNQAAAVYEETTTGLFDNVQSAKEELEQVKAQIAEYEAAIVGNTYYEDYQVEYYKNIYDENLEILKKRMEEWNVSWSEVTNGGMSSSNMPGIMENSIVSGGDAGGGQGTNSQHSQYVTVLSSLYKVLEQNLKDYEQARADYENAVENADFKLQTLKLQISSLEQKYAEALNSYESNILQAQLTRETALSNGEKAEGIYEANIEKAEADLQKLQAAKEEAEENLAALEAHICEGCYYGRQAGTLLRVNVRAGENIGSESPLYTLSNTEEITVTVSVGQSHIAGLAVGDTAMVQSAEGGRYNGVITAVNPISGSDSKASITYNVTVTLSEGAQALSANETVIVYFGLGNGAQENEN